MALHIHGCIIEDRLRCGHLCEGRHTLSTCRNRNGNLTGHVAGLATLILKNTGVHFFYLRVVLAKRVVSAGRLEDSACDRCLLNVRLVQIRFFTVGGQVLCDRHTLHPWSTEFEGGSLARRFGRVDPHVRHDAQVALRLHYVAHLALEPADLLLTRRVKQGVHALSVRRQAFCCLLSRVVLLVGEEQAQRPEVYLFEGVAAERVLRLIELTKQLGGLGRVVNINHYFYNCLGSPSSSFYPN